MPAPLTSEALATLANDRITARIRTLRDDVAAAIDAEPMDWSEDLARLGVVVNVTSWKSLRGKLASAFGAVATDVAGQKMAATIRYRSLTGEVAVTFRVPRERIVSTMGGDWQ